MDQDDMVTVDRITLEKIQFGIQRMVSSATIDDLQYDNIEDFTTRSIIQRLTFYLWGNKVNEEDCEAVVRVYPATIWEELKRDFWPNWLKRKFPVRYSKDVTLHNHKHYHMCPHLNYKDDRKH